MKKKSWDKSTLFLLFSGIILIAAALGMLIPGLLDYKKSEDTYEELNEQYVQMTPVEKEPAAQPQENTAWWYEDVNINLAELKKVNADIIGWIRFDNIAQLSYPILYSGDDEKYLRTDIYGDSTTAGCIFMEGLNTPDFNDYHTILYGHNMRNLSMFGSLKKYKTADFYEGNQYFTVYTENMAYRYQIFACRDVPETDEVYSVGFMPDDTYQNFINEMIKKSYYDTGVSVKKEDRVMTLSTCSTTGNRFVVHAVRVEEHALQ